MAKKKFVKEFEKPMKMFLAHGGGIGEGYPRIDEVEIEIKNDDWVIYPSGVLTQREFHSSYKYCDTFEEAREWLVKRFEREAHDAKLTLGHAERSLEHVKNLRPEVLEPGVTG
jgi:hypothetical protein